MPEPTEAVEQVQTAPAPIEPAAESTPSREEVYTQIADAHASGASKGEIERLEAQLVAPAEPEPAAEEPAETEPAPEPENPPAGETPPEEPKGEKEPDRFRFKDAEDRAVAQIAKAKGISLVAAAKLYAGEPDSTPTPAIPEPPTVPPALAAIDTEIASHEATLARIKEDRKAYLAEPAVFAEELAELDGQRDEALAAISKASGKRASVEFQESQQASTRQMQEQQRQQELEDTAKVYPDLADPETPLWMLSAQLSQKWRAAGDPRADDVRACANEAAKRLSLKAVASKPATPASPVTPSVKSPGPAPGTRSSTPAPPARTETEVLAETEGRAMAAALGETYIAGRNYFIPVETR